MRARAGAYFHVGKNMPGYLPESDVTLVRSRKVASEVLEADLMHDWLSHEQVCESENCAVCCEYLDAHTQIHNDETQVTADGLVYWMTPVESD
jgi:hypothetical protein